MSILVELNNAFDLEYQSAANVSPDINMYEKSYFFTKAVDKIIMDAIPLFDKTESSKRLLQPLLVQNFQASFTLVNCEFEGYTKYKVSYPEDFRLLMRISINSVECGKLLISKEDRIDNLNESIRNPFRKPNKRKVIKVTGEKDYNKFDYLYVSEGVTIKDISISYLKYNKPIILMDFADDPSYIGDETIKGLDVATNTEINEEFYPAIINTAVLFAISTLRENTLNTKLKL